MPNEATSACISIRSILRGIPLDDSSSSEQVRASNQFRRECSWVLKTTMALTFSPLVNTYTANSTASLPGTFLCNQSQPNCTNGSNPHADAAHKYAIGTFNLYDTQHNRNSIDNNGMTIISTVHYCEFRAIPNALTPMHSGLATQMVYGDAYGFPLADDVVAHELTHGVTQHESNLFYYYQSGAINESFRMCGVSITTRRMVRATMQLASNGRSVKISQVLVPSAA